MQLCDFRTALEQGLLFLSGQIVAHPIFAHILTLVGLVLGLVSGVETAVYVAIALGWIVTFLWINESSRRHRIIRRLVLSVFIPGAVWCAFGWLALSQYKQHQQAKLPQSQLPEPTKQETGLSKKDVQDAIREMLSKVWKSEPSKGTGQEQSKTTPEKRPKIEPDLGSKPPPRILQQIGANVDAGTSDRLQVIIFNYDKSASFKCELWLTRGHMWQDSWKRYVKHADLAEFFLGTVKLERNDRYYVAFAERTPENVAVIYSIGREREMKLKRTGLYWFQLTERCNGGISAGGMTFEWQPDKPLKFISDPPKPLPDLDLSE